MSQIASETQVPTNADFGHEIPGEGKGRAEGCRWKRARPGGMDSQGNVHGRRFRRQAGESG
jgi:hypothetical protein